MELIQLHTDEIGRLWIPEDLQARLVPGTVLTVERRENEIVTLRVDIQADVSESPEDEASARLVWEGGVLVFTGEVSEDFDWEGFENRQREEQIFRNWISNE